MNNGSYSSAENRKNNDNEGNRSLSGLNFRDLVHTMDKDKENQPQDVNEGNIYFTNDFNQAQHTNNDLAQDDRKPNFIKRIILWIKQKLSNFIEKIFLLRFIRDFFSYLFTRFRVILILMSVFAELIGTQAELIKKFVIKRMFWGRGSLFNFSVKFFSLFLVVLIVMSIAYRGRRVEASYQIATEAGNPNQKQYQAGVIPQRSNASTVRNEDAVATELEEYVVKGGDTLSTIAEFTGVNVKSILFHNNLKETDIIKPGMKLKIPPGNGLVVKVKDGDSIASLAEKYKVNAQNILDINKNVLEPPDYKLTAGMELFLPDGVAPEPPKPKPAPTPIYSGVVASSGSASTGTSAPATAGGRWLGWPVAGGGRLTQCYSGWHNGIDIADKSYPGVVAAAPGKVVFAGCQSGSCPALNSYTPGGWGLAWTVIIDHGNGFSTLYGHLNNIYVSSGQSVSAGQSIGQMGQTGLAYGVHLHFMLVYSGTWSTLNPARYMTTGICGY